MSRAKVQKLSFWIYLKVKRAIPTEKSFRGEKRD